MDFCLYLFIPLSFTDFFIFQKIEHQKLVKFTEKYWLLQKSLDIGNFLLVESFRVKISFNFIIPNFFQFQNNSKFFSFQKILIFLFNYELKCAPNITKIIFFSFRKILFFYSIFLSLIVKTNARIIEPKD